MERSFVEITQIYFSSVPAFYTKATKKTRLFWIGKKK